MQIVYLLRCRDLTVYIGCTSNLKARLVRHRRGEIHYTKSRLPVELISFISFENKYKAYFFEKYLKSGSGRAFANKRLI